MWNVSMKCSILSFPVKPKLQFVVTRKNAHLPIHVYKKQMYSFVLPDLGSVFRKQSSELLIPHKGKPLSDMGFPWSALLFLVLLCAFPPARRSVAVAVAVCTHLGSFAQEGALACAVYKCCKMGKLINSTTEGNVSVSNYQLCFLSGLKYQSYGFISCYLPQGRLLFYYSLW